MKYDKISLRRKIISQRKKKYINAKKFNFSLIFKLIKKHFNKKKISIAAYYPSNYEVDIMQFIKSASKNKFKILLPVIKNSNIMKFKKWVYKEPLYLNKFGIMEPLGTNKEIIPDLVLVPLVAYDNSLNRIGYGKGYYDRKLAELTKVKKNMISMGVAHSFQKCTSVPIKKHDFKLDYIFTERGIISSN